MRYIEFRGISSKTRNWVYGYLHEDIQQRYRFRYIIERGFVPALSMPNERFIEVIPETVGQFTGLLDKNGTKIFEGDKVKVLNTTTKRHIDNSFIVIFENGSFCLNVVTDTTNENESSSTSFHRVMFESINNAGKEIELEVIGTIHE